MKVVYSLVASLFIIQIFCLHILRSVLASETVMSTPTTNILINNFCNTYVENQITAEINTGENSASKNTGSGFVSTGNAALISHTSNQACSSDIEINSSPNYFFGSEEIRQHRIHVLNNNNAEVENQTTAEVNTGENSASENTGSGFVLTGNASQVSHLSNQAGISNIEIISTSNYNMDSEVIEKHNIKILQSNNAKVKNVDKIGSTTGGNQADYNSGFTRVLTGHSSLEFLSDTFLNTSSLNFYSP